VRDPPDRRQLFRTDCGAAGRHHHVLVPAEQGGRLDEIGDLGEAPPQLVEHGLAHNEKPISTTSPATGRNQQVCGDAAGRRGSSEDDLPLRMNRVRFR